MGGYFVSFSQNAFCSASSMARSSNSWKLDGSASNGWDREAALRVLGSLVRYRKDYSAGMLQSSSMYCAKASFTRSGTTFGCRLTKTMYSVVTFGNDLASSGTFSPIRRRRNDNHVSVLPPPVPFCSDGFLVSALIVEAGVA